MGIGGTASVQQPPPPTVLKKELLGERNIEAMRESSKRAAPRDRDAMLAELESLDKQILGVRHKVQPMLTHRLHLLILRACVRTLSSQANVRSLLSPH
jgi:hypothetical protein